MTGWDTREPFQEFLKGYDMVIKSDEAFRIVEVIDLAILVSGPV